MKAIEHWVAKKSPEHLALQSTFVNTRAKIAWVLWKGNSLPDFTLQTFINGNKCVSTFTLPMLMGSAQLRSLLKITGIPLYILIDKDGKVAFISEGYSEDIETKVIKALGK